MFCVCVCVCACVRGCVRACVWWSAGDREEEEPETCGRAKAHTHQACVKFRIL